MNEFRLGTEIGHPWYRYIRIPYSDSLDVGVSVNATMSTGVVTAMWVMNILFDE